MRILIILLVFVASCNQQEQQGHSHEEEGGHSHEEGSVSVDTTIWTSKTELFVEYPSLIVNEKSRFAAHFTMIDKHRAISEGTVTVSLVKGGKGIRNKKDEPSSPGIYTPTLQPSAPGLHELYFDLETPEYKEKIPLGTVMVYASAEEAMAANPPEDEANVISFLKEQAWKTNFQTVKTEKRNLFQTVNTSGVWKVLPSGHQQVVARSNGSVQFVSSSITEGVKVKKGEVLMTISSAEFTSGNLSSEIQKARAVYEQAASEFERKKELAESRIIPKADLEKAESAYKVAKAEYETLNRGFSPKGKRIVSPMNGFIEMIKVNNGEFVKEGDPLFTVINNKTGLLEVFVNPTDAAGLSEIQNLWYAPSRGKWSGLKENQGKLLSITNSVNSDKPFLSLFAEVNEVIYWPEGSFAEVQLGLGNGEEVLAIPKKALLEDYGSYSVIVQLSGESFERRQVSTGKENGDWVEIVKGLKEGEVVVSEGAYQVKMASMSGQVPGHGHAH